MSLQRTLRSSILFSGIGLHSGKNVRLVLSPAPCNSGITFVRTDTTPNVSIPAVIDNVVNTRYSTTIGSSGYAVASIEHVMAALYGVGVDNAIAEIDGPEVPIMDGSSGSFVEAIKKAGVTEQPERKKVLVVTQSVGISEGDGSIEVHPSASFEVTCTMSYRHPSLSNEVRHFNADEEDFIAEYARARTFGFLAEVEYLQAQGLAKGGSLANAVIIGRHGVLNSEGLRFHDEPVRHKILDLTGDLLLAGHSIVGHVRASRSGHYLNCRLVKRLLACAECWTLAEAGALEPFPPWAPGPSLVEGRRHLLP